MNKLDDFLKQCDKDIATWAANKRNEALINGLKPSDDSFYRFEAFKELVLRELFELKNEKKVVKKVTKKKSTK